MYSKGKTVKLSNILFDIESFFIKLWNNILMKTMLTKFFIQKKTTILRLLHYNVNFPVNTKWLKLTKANAFVD